MTARGGGPLAVDERKPLLRDAQVYEFPTPKISEGGGRDDEGEAQNRRGSILLLNSWLAGG